MKNFLEDIAAELIEAEILRVGKIYRRKSVHAKAYTVVWSEVVHEV